MTFPFIRFLCISVPLLLVLLFRSTNPPTSSSLRGADEKPDRNWCMLTRDLVPREDRWLPTIEHFPHTLEWYADCWAYVQREQPGAGKNARGGFLVDEYVYKKLQKKYWNRAFLPAMEWPVQLISETTDIDYSRTMTKSYSGSGWFQSPESCDSFRDRMWEKLEVNVPTTSAQEYRIGILNRNESRAIADVDMLVEKLKSTYPAAHVDVRAIDSEYTLTREEDSLASQAQWFANQDLVIQAHGAAMTNVVFMRPGTSVMELYPRYYYNDMFHELMGQCGVKRGWYYDTPKKGVTDEAARHETEAHWDDRFQNKKRDISFKWTRLDHRIDALLKAVDV